MQIKNLKSTENKEKEEEEEEEERPLMIKRRKLM
jgi:hypothetical protein